MIDKRNKCLEGEPHSKNGKEVKKEKIPYHSKKPS